MWRRLPSLSKIRLSLGDNLGLRHKVLHFWQELGRVFQTLDRQQAALSLFVLPDLLYYLPMPLGYRKGFHTVHSNGKIVPPTRIIFPNTKIIMSLTAKRIIFLYEQRIIVLNEQGIMCLVKALRAARPALLSPDAPRLPQGLPYGTFRQSIQMEKSKEKNLPLKQNYLA